MKIRHFLLFTLLFVVLICTGCKGGGEDRFAYRERNVAFVVEGTTRGFAFRAEVCREIDGGGGTRDTLRYLSPASLAGVTLTRDFDGTLTLSAGELSRACEADEVEGMLLPIRLLFDTPTDVQTVRHTSDGSTRITLADGVTVVIAPDGLPATITTPQTILTLQAKG